jgi:hypothetical protein
MKAEDVKVPEHDKVEYVEVTVIQIDGDAKGFKFIVEIIPVVGSILKSVPV